MKIAVLSDIHANIVALDAVLADCSLFDVDCYFILGDFIGYYYWPSDVLDRVENLRSVEMIQGNHERLLKKALENEQARIAIRQKYGHGVDIAIQTLSDDKKIKLLELPLEKRIEIDQTIFFLCHGSPFDADKYVYPDAEKSVFEGNVIPNADFILMGHTHYPFCCYQKGVVFANPGSVGQPRDIGDLASYLIIDTKNKSLVFRRVPFNTQVVIDAAAKMDPDLQYLQRIFSRNVQTRDSLDDVI